MRTLLHPALVHPAGSDPGLWIDLPDEGRALLFDLPALEHLPPRKLARVAHVVVTHMHMDHFVGFDHLLRSALRREEPLTITGPSGFLASVRGRIGAYTWNLIESYPLRLRVQEVTGGRIRAEEYGGWSSMRGVAGGEREFGGTVHAERAFRVDVVELDHGIPVLGVAVREVEHLAINRDRLEREGLVPGEWLGELKDAVRRGAERDTPIEVEQGDGGRSTRPLGALADAIVVRGRGQVIVYLTDLVGSEANLERAAALAHDADLLVCEAVFLDEDRSLAAARKHLTARQAGELARRAGARRLAVFHFSSRYQGREAELMREASEAFGSAILPLPVATIRP